MSLKDSLTNEKLNARFENPFALVTYAIAMAKVRVRRGEGLNSNPANDVLEIIAKGHDLLREDEEEDDEDQEEIKEPKSNASKNSHHLSAAVR